MLFNVQEYTPERRPKARELETADRNAYNWKQERRFYAAPGRTEDMEARPVLWIVIPCYNEEQVLPLTAPLFLRKLQQLEEDGKISRNSRILFVNDGSKDGTWEIIRKLAEEHEECIGICQSRNRGHQNAVLAGLMEAKDRCDITISIDCDGQDDLDAMDEMVEKYLAGAEVVYGVRSQRKTDTWFKRTTAQAFYRLMNSMGAEVVYNHADYRLISAKVLQHFADFEEVNIFLRGMVPLVGFPSDTVYYERNVRLAGESHYLQHPWRASHDLGCGSGMPGQHGGWLGIHGVHYLPAGRNPADQHRRAGPVYRQDLHGDKTPAEIYHLRPDLGTGNPALDRGNGSGNVTDRKSAGWKKLTNPCNRAYSGRKATESDVFGLFWLAFYWYRRYNQFCKSMYICTHNAM